MGQDILSLKLSLISSIVILELMITKIYLGAICGNTYSLVVSSEVWDSVVIKLVGQPSKRGLLRP